MVDRSDLEKVGQREVFEYPTATIYENIVRVEKFLQEFLKNPTFSFQYNGGDWLNREQYLNIIESLLVSRDEKGNLRGDIVPDNHKLGESVHIFIKEILPNPTSRGKSEEIALEKIGSMDVALGFLIETYKTFDDDDIIRESDHVDQIITFKETDFNDDYCTSNRFHNLWYAIFKIEQEADEERERSYGK